MGRFCIGKIANGALINCLLNVLLLKKGVESRQKEMLKASRRIT